mgnify:CR=1 FL=1
MLIDAHNHPNWHGYDSKRILENMDEQGIDQLWLFTWEVSEDEYPPSYHKVLPPTGLGIPLEDVISVGKEAPDRFVMGYMPHPKRPDAIDRLKAAVEIHGEFHRVLLGNGECFREGWCPRLSGSSRTSTRADPRSGLVSLTLLLSRTRMRPNSAALQAATGSWR